MLPFADCDLIHPHDGDPIQRTFRLLLLQGLFVNVADRAPVQETKQGNGFDAHHFAQLDHQTGQRRGDSGFLAHEGDRFRHYSTVRAVHAVVLDPKVGWVLPEHEMLDLKPPEGMSGLESTVALSALEVVVDSFQGQHYGGTIPTRLYFLVGNDIVLHCQQFCETIQLHRAGTPVYSDDLMTMTG